MATLAADGIVAVGPGPRRRRDANVETSPHKIRIDTAPHLLQPPALNARTMSTIPNGAGAGPRSICRPAV